jgi:multidrug transporter EmrE-like cation transporter
MLHLISYLKKLPLLFYILASSTFNIVGDYYAKKWSIEIDNIFLIMALLAFLMSTVFYMFSLLKKGLIITATLWTIVAMSGFVVIGFLIFQETITVWQIVGIIVGAISVLLLNFPEKHGKNI